MCYESQALAPSTRVLSMSAILWRTKLMTKVRIKLCNAPCRDTRALRGRGNDAVHVTKKVHLNGDLESTTNEMGGPISLLHPQHTHAKQHWLTVYV